MPVPEGEGSLALEIPLLSCNQPNSIFQALRFHNLFTFSLNKESFIKGELMPQKRVGGIQLHRFSLRNPYRITKHTQPVASREPRVNTFFFSLSNVTHTLRKMVLTKQNQEKVYLKALLSRVRSSMFPLFQVTLTSRAFPNRSYHFFNSIRSQQKMPLLCVLVKGHCIPVW